MALHRLSSHGMALRRVASHPTAWHRMAWHGMAWHGMAWHGMAWHGMGHAMIWYSVASNRIASHHIVGHRIALEGIVEQDGRPFFSGRNRVFYLFQGRFMPPYVSSVRFAFSRQFCSAFSHWKHQSTAGDRPLKTAR